MSWPLSLPLLWGVLGFWVFCCFGSFARCFGLSSSAALGVGFVCLGLLLLRVLVALKATRRPERGQKLPKVGLTHIEGDALSIVRLPRPATCGNL